MRASIRIAAALLVAAGGIAAAQAKPKVASDVSVWKGVVLANDYEAHKMTVKGPNGNLHEFTLPAAATNQFKVNVGDTVTVKFVESVVLYLRRPGDASVAAPPPSVTVTPANLPDINEVRIVNVLCKITGVDMKTRIIAFADPNGKIMSFTVAPGVAAFNSTKVGDQMILSYNEATAIDITK